MTKAILIDPETCIVQEILLGFGLQDICNKLESESTIALYPEFDRNVENHILYVDDFVIYRSPEDIPEAFTLQMFGDRFIYGKAILVSYKQDGSVRLDVKVSYQYVADQISFPNRDLAIKTLMQHRREQVEHYLF
jgi:hypothetical protein